MCRKKPLPTRDFLFFSITLKDFITALWLGEKPRSCPAPCERLQSTKCWLHGFKCHPKVYSSVFLEGCEHPGAVLKYLFHLISQGLVKCCLAPPKVLFPRVFGASSRSVKVLPLWRTGGIKVIQKTKKEGEEGQCSEGQEGGNEEQGEKEKHGHIREKISLKAAPTECPQWGEVAWHPSLGIKMEIFHSKTPKIPRFCSRTREKEAEGFCEAPGLVLSPAGIWGLSLLGLPGFSSSPADSQEFTKYTRCHIRGGFPLSFWLCFCFFPWLFHPKWLGRAARWQKEQDKCLWFLIRASELSNLLIPGTFQGWPQCVLGTWALQGIKINCWFCRMNFECKASV